MGRGPKETGRGRALDVPICAGLVLPEVVRIYSNVAVEDGGVHLETPLRPSPAQGFSKCFGQSCVVISVETLFLLMGSTM